MQVHLDTTLGRLSRILDTDHYALVVQNQRQCKYLCCFPHIDSYGDVNTRLVSVSFTPLLTFVWIGIFELFKWAAIGETL